MAILVTQSTSQPIWFTDSTATYFNNQNYCGPRVYNFLGGMPSYLSIDASQSTLTLSTSNTADKGVH